jgi:hypothetical protein
MRPFQFLIKRRLTKIRFRFAAWILIKTKGQKAYPATRIPVELRGPCFKTGRTVVFFCMHGAYSA